MRSLYVYINKPFNADMREGRNKWIVRPAQEKELTPGRNWNALLFHMNANGSRPHERKLTPKLI